MNRDQRKTEAYWDHYGTLWKESLVEQGELLKKPAVDRNYETSFTFGLVFDHWQLILFSYSWGKPISELAQYFPGILHYWEESDRLAREINREEPVFVWRDRSVNFYQIAFWLVGLALTLNIPDDQWQRLLALIGNEGEDILLDRIIATRQPGRKIGSSLCHPKPYARLLAAIDAPANQQARKLASFVTHWYRELARRNYDHGPYWYIYETVHEDTYFGYWCVEAVAAVKAFGLDDRLCLGHPHYPGDLLRPDGPTTHVPYTEEQWARALGKPLPKEEGEQSNWLIRWYHGLRKELRAALGDDKKKNPPRKKQQDAP